MNSLVFGLFDDLRIFVYFLRPAVHNLSPVQERLRFKIFIRSGSPAIIPFLSSTISFLIIVFLASYKLFCKYLKLSQIPYHFD